MNPVLISVWLVICGIGVFQQVAAQPKPLLSMTRTVPILSSPQILTDEQMKKLQPKADAGVATGREPPPVEAGKVALNKQIIGGEMSTRGRFPWQALVTIEGQYTCGGSLITPNYVLTASHCTDGFKYFIILLGAQNRTVYEEGRVAFEVSKYINHPRWNSDSLNNDIALLPLPVSITSSSAYIRPVRLPTPLQATKTFIGENVTISGWGRVSDESPSASLYLNYVGLNVISNADCASFYGTYYVIGSNICCSGAERRATCNGDSGGPLVYKEADGAFTQVGIVSFGSGEGCAKGFPSVFTRVSAHINWISSRTGQAVRFR